MVNDDIELGMGVLVRISSIYIHANGYHHSFLL